MEEKRLSIEQKYNIIIEDCLYGDTPYNVTLRALDSKGRPIGEYISYFKKLFKQGNLHLPQDKINILQKLRILPMQIVNLEEYAKQYNISTMKVSRIFRDYESINQLIAKHKNSIICSTDTMDYYGIKDYNAIILSKEDITVREKSGYVRFVIATFGTHALNGIFINKDYIDSVLANFDDSERSIIESIYGINGKTNTSALKLSKSINYKIKDINAILKKAGKVISQGKSAYFSLSDLKEQKNRLEMVLSKINKQRNIELYSRIISRIEQLQLLIGECNKAYERFMKDEDIFHDDEVIPSSGKSHLDFSLDDNNLYLEAMNEIFGATRGNSLSGKKKEKQRKEIELAQLQGKIDSQKEKEEDLEKLLGTKERNI